MKERLILSLLCLSLIVSLVLIIGCATESYEKKNYILEARRASSAETGDYQNIIEVRRFSIDPAFSSKGLIYRTGQFEYESDFYNEFLLSPEVMITDKIRDWLWESGLTQRVLDNGSYIEPTHVIEGSITALYGDYRNISSPEAVMEIRVFLLEVDVGMDPVIIFGNTYKSIVSIESEGATGLVAALDKSLIEILTDLEDDLAQNLP